MNDYAFIPTNYYNTDSASISPPHSISSPGYSLDTSTHVNSYATTPSYHTASHVSKKRNLEQANPDDVTTNYKKKLKRYGMF